MNPENEPTLFVVGSSHKEANLTVRERFSLNESEINSLEDDVLSIEGVDECLVLNTCNRLEIYGVRKESLSMESVYAKICSHKKLRSTDFAKHSFIVEKSKAIEHTVELASGLLSQMIGETEILGQMKQTYQKAKELGKTQKHLNRLFEKSFQSAKLIRSETGIGRGQISIGNIAVNLAKRIFGDITKSRILIIGSGEVSERTVQALKSNAVNDLTVTSRTKEKTDILADQFGAASLGFNHFKSQIGQFDIIISSTSAPTAILEVNDFSEALKKRPNRPLFLIDLAVPRDIPESVGRLENVYLYNLDALAKIANETLAFRKSEIKKAEQLIKSQVWSLWLQLKRRSMFHKFQ